MIRSSLEPGSPHAFTCLGIRRGVFQFYRSATNGPTMYYGQAGFTAPIYTKLTRSGDTFTSSFSLDGKGWIQIGSTVISMPDRVYVGFVTSGLIETGNFIIDRIETVNVPPLNVLPSVTLQALARDNSAVTGPLRLMASPEDTDGYIPMVEFFQGNIRLGQATEPPFELLVNASAGSHQFTARAYDNFGEMVSSSSEPLEIKPIEITLESAGAGGLELMHAGNPGVTYLAEESADLSNWSPVATNAPVEGIVRLSFPYAAREMFFRVRPR